MKASILAIGTEITTGQIVNKNASWISAKLKSAGVQVAMHITVPDDHDLILDALTLSEKRSDVLFVTGGLGPTSDDFTRDLISEWSQTKMNFDENSWQQIIERLVPRGFPVRDIQRQQCYFPEGSQILKNSEGTANGFYLEVKKPSGVKKVFVLPGPPREIDAIWKSNIEGWLQKNTVDLVKLVTKAWDTIGVGESDVALKVEEALQGRPTSETFEIGYRVHLPYVEIKLSYLENEAELFKPYIQKVDRLLAEITLAKDFEDLADIVSKKVQQKDFTFYDYVTGGFLHARLSPYLKSHANYSWKQSNEKPTVDLFENEESFLALLPFEDDKSLLIFEWLGQRKQIMIEAPMKSSSMGERRKQYMAEMALAHLSQTGGSFN